MSPPLRAMMGGADGAPDAARLDWEDR